MRTTTTIILALLVLGVGSIALQIYLSRRQSKWPGLMLPAISLLYALLMVLGIAVNDGTNATTIFITIASTFLLSSIPTIVYICIYFACRERITKKRELDKMNIQDLE